MRKRFLWSVIAVIAITIIGMIVMMTSDPYGLESGLGQAFGISFVIALVIVVLVRFLIFLIRGTIVTMIRKPNDNDKK